MKKNKTILFIIVFFAILLGVKFLFFNGKENNEQVGNKAKSDMPLAVTAYIAKPFEFSGKVYASGKVGAMNEIEIQPEVSGKITSILFNEGEQVNEGAVLLKINDIDLQAQFSKSKIQLKLAEEKLSRLKKLLAINGISEEEFDTQENEVNSIKADMDIINAQINKATIRAPFTGIIGLKNVSIGAYVTPGQTLTSLIQLRPVYIEFSIPEKYSSSVSKGTPLTFLSEDTEQAKEYKATIYAVEPKVDEATKTIRGRALYNGNVTFYPGSFVKVYIELGKPVNSLMIPTQSIIPVLKGQKVFVSRNGRAEDVKVISGIRTEDKIQILEGLQEGDTILTSGLLSVRKGTKLKILKVEN